MITVGNECVAKSRRLHERAGARQCRLVWCRLDDHGVCLPRLRYGLSPWARSVS
jgi:hypothetical protein